jgi:hypothetical protein
MAARRGRPKKENAVRKPCGESTGEEIIPAPFNMAGVKDVEVVHEGKILHLRQRKPELQRLFEEGRLREHFRIAGEQYAQLVMDYRRSLDAPKPNASVSRPEGRTGQEGNVWDAMAPDEQEALAGFCARLERRYDQVWVLLLDRFNGISVKRAVDALCLNDEGLHGDRLELAKDGLKLLAKHWGIEERKDKKTA